MRLTGKWSVGASSSLTTRRLLMVVINRLGVLEPIWWIILHIIVTPTMVWSTEYRHRKSSSSSLVTPLVLDWLLFYILSRILSLLHNKEEDDAFSIWSVAIENGVVERTWLIMSLPVTVSTTTTLFVFSISLTTSFSSYRETHNLPRGDIRIDLCAIKHGD